ncbi:NAD(P)H-quinone oxidoreductase [Xanthovirga aplysinae]|uniref:NAD(P)H-quinone oxidoreductase n=1 Tax=Xanthovirga aplysinae TaxID=2529853 RepID=UPI0012BD17EA|nr:NAD(P)H-quinone oxidoreductase [Xanthovirga aplysinae]MTI30297.1 NAD(P)H-quinone oxidoreductase [Xanthovirga aplysinae]
MKAIIASGKGGPDSLSIGEWPKPKPSSYDVLVKVEASAINRADTLQREGKYPVPEGESPILGLEMSGTIVACGDKVTKWHVGDQVCGLLGGGGHAEFAIIHEDMAMTIPTGWSMEEAAAMPEVFLTAYQSLKWICQLKKGETVLIHAGASGVGTAAIQLAKAIGAKVLVTASAEKHDICLQLGAELAIDYKKEDFQEAVKGYSKGRGVDVVVDFIAGPYLQQNINSLAIDGRMVLLAFLGGPKVDHLNLAALLMKRLQINGSTLRSRSQVYKKELTQDFKKFAWPLFESGQLKVVLDKVYNWKNIPDAHRRMEANISMGKIVLKVN